MTRHTKVPLIAWLTIGALGLAAVRVAGQRPSSGVPFEGLTPAQRQAFDDGDRAFRRVYTMAEGLGPVFNDDSCADCHRNGGASNRTVTRFGRLLSNSFDPLTELGGSLVQSRGIGSVTTADGTHTFTGEGPPLESNIRATRRSSAVLGLGLLDTVPIETWLALAESERAADPTTAGRVHLVFDRTAGQTTVGKFGWKAQVGSLREFSGEALLNEMGITSPGFRDEVCPQGDCAALSFNPAPALNDDGREAEAITNFMTMLAPPPRGPATESAIAGEQVFNDLGCAACHRAEFRAGPSAVRSINLVTFRPYSDFLLHDMGTLGDGIAQGQAGGRDMRTAPLWGLRALNRFLHDGSARSIEDAIRRHDGQGRAARDRFNALDAVHLSWLLEFLGTL
jgi:CxxC motif-containing protein (DUF1111 family)